MKEFGLSFKGGLARGFGSIGVLRFMQEEGLKPKVVAGSSSGAIVAAMYALGFKWEKMMEFIDGFRFFSIVSPKSLLVDGTIVSYKKYRKAMLDRVSDCNIEDLPVKLVVFVSDPVTKQRVCIEKGSICDAVMASSAYPAVFPNVFIDGKRYLDGDLIPGFSPAEIKIHGAEKVIGVSWEETIRWKRAKHSLIGNILEAYRIMSGQLHRIHDESDPPDMEIHFDAGDNSIIDFKHMKRLTNRAYHRTKEKRDEIYKLLE